MKTYNKSIVTTLLFLIALITNAQTSADYKHPFSKGTQVNISSNFLNSTVYYSSDNYKHPVNTVIETDTKIQIPACCSKVRVNSFYSASYYKHPYTKFSFKPCELEFVCNNEMPLKCCS